jgi:hypothetical protein
MISFRLRVFEPLENLGKSFTARIFRGFGPRQERVGRISRGGSSGVPRRLTRRFGTLVGARLIGAIRALYARPERLEQVESSENVTGGNAR